MNNPKFMSRETFNELIDNIEILEKITLYGRQNIKYHVQLLQQENQKYKETFDKIRNHCEIEINASNHYLKNHKSQKELCHKVAHQRILKILNEVE